MIYFKLPFSENISTIEESSDKFPVRFISFDQSKVLDFNGKIKIISKKEFSKTEIFCHSLLSNVLDFKVENQFDYQQKLEDVIHFVKENNLSKLVISRRKLVEFHDSKLNLSQTFLNLCDAYPNAFVYLFIKENQCWIGGFSEILGKFHKKTCEFETMSLAGTIPINENWTSKEIAEQQIVTDFIRKILNPYSTKIEQSNTYDHPSGSIKHLRTDFKLKIKKEDLEIIISELHPTPAVCGIPKEFCKSAISKFEEHTRKFYAGYSKVETEETIQYFVNLRCAEIFTNAAVIYVGGGITAESSPNKEWQETELKAEAILKNISKNW